MAELRLITHKTKAWIAKDWLRMGLYLTLFSFFFLALYASHQSRDLPENSNQGILTESDIKPEKPAYLDLNITEKRIYLDYLLDDPEGLISSDFQVLHQLRDRVHFWFQVYNIYENTDIILHDKDFPWIIYKVVDVAGLSEKERIRKVVFEIRKLKKFRGRIREQQGLRNSIEFALEKSGQYIETMEKIFEENHMPIELTRLPIVESSFNPKAYSRSGAAGLWQFMRKTGKHFLNNIHQKLILCFCQFNKA